MKKTDKKSYFVISFDFSGHGKICKHNFINGLKIPALDGTATSEDYMWLVQLLMIYVPRMINDKNLSHLFHQTPVLKKSDNDGKATDASPVPFFQCQFCHRLLTEPRNNYLNFLLKKLLRLLNRWGFGAVRRLLHSKMRGFRNLYQRENAQRKNVVIIDFYRVEFSIHND